MGRSASFGLDSIYFLAHGVVRDMVVGNLRFIFAFLVLVEGVVVVVVVVVVAVGNDVAVFVPFICCFLVIVFGCCVCY